MLFNQFSTVSGGGGIGAIIGISGVNGGGIIPVDFFPGTMLPPPSQQTNQTADFLSLARQLFQIILRSRSHSSQFPAIPIDDSEMEQILNNFVTRIFGASNLSTAPAGLAPNRIEALPVTVEPSEFDCSICRETAKTGDEKCVQLPCKHCFHFECIEPWLRRVASCPICRKVIE